MRTAYAFDDSFFMKALSSRSQRLLIFICHGEAITLAAPTPEPGGFLLRFFIWPNKNLAGEAKSASIRRG